MTDTVLNVTGKCVADDRAILFLQRRCLQWVIQFFCFNGCCLIDAHDSKTNVMSCLMIKPFKVVCMVIKTQISLDIRF